MKSPEKKFSRKSAPERSARMVEQICGCKWSLTVFNLLQNGIKRPGEMVRSVDALTTKVLNQCLRRNVKFGIIERLAYPEIPPRVEYQVTPLGKKFIRILDQIEKLQEEIEKRI
jgi:DNA-binding HxlR family transcriptional regulator